MSENLRISRWIPINIRLFGCNVQEGISGVAYNIARLDPRFTISDRVKGFWYIYNKAIAHPNVKRVTAG